MKKRFHQVVSLGRTKTATNSIILFGGSFAGSLLSVIAVIFVSRELGPANFGILAIFTALVNILLGLTDFGLSTTAVKLVSQYLGEDVHRADVTKKVIVFLEIISGLMVATFGLIFAGPIARLISGNDSSSVLFAVRLAFVAGAFSSAGAFLSPFLNAHEQFLKNALFGFSSAVFKLIGVLLLVGLGALTLTNVLWLYVLLAITFFILGLIIAPFRLKVKATRNEEKRALKEIVHFSKWILLSYFATVISGRLDVFLLTRFQGTTATGLYAAAQQLVTVMPLLIGAITSVLLPQVSRYKTSKEFMSYIKKVVVGAIGINLLFAPVLLISGPVIQFVFGAKYVGSLEAFQILFIGYMVALVANPVSLVFYGMNKPRMLTLFNYIQLVISVALNLLLIPYLGVIGAAITFLVINVIGAGLSLATALKYIKRLEKTA